MRLHSDLALVRSAFSTSLTARTEAVAGTAALAAFLDPPARWPTVKRRTPRESQRDARTRYLAQLLGQSLRLLPWAESGPIPREWRFPVDAELPMALRTRADHDGEGPSSQGSQDTVVSPDYAERTALARLRTSSHPLMIEQGRYMGLGRTERYCPFCRPGTLVVEDVTHFLFDCSIYSSLRATHSSLYEGLPSSSPAAFLTQDQGQVAAFIHKCWARREEAVSALAG